MSPAQKFAHVTIKADLAPFTEAMHRLAAAFARVAPTFERQLLQGRPSVRIYRGPRRPYGRQRRAR